ncbi:hypothetical protein NDU88_003202 [Pleurodeles waltl]|uniref:Uncharacterized protein n=1 Tax=Pleurodeles waltl TaxID=8319 RepID=A0AAV7SD28_PLEWA|nr:hypothetical protein NDU88_003202 [Pleurodeles waltl]
MLVGEAQTPDNSAWPEKRATVGTATLDLDRGFPCGPASDRHGSPCGLAGMRRSDPCRSKIGAGMWSSVENVGTILWYLAVFLLETAGRWPNYLNPREDVNLLLQLFCSNV